MNQQELTMKARNYYEGKQSDRNLCMSSDGVIINHHFGIGDFNRRKFPHGMTQEEITRELDRLEMAQIDTLTDLMDVKPGDKVLDAGCGRGGTSISLSRRSGAKTVGVTISSYQGNFAKALVERINSDPSQKPVESEFVVGDYLKLEMSNGEFDHVLTSEATHYTYYLSELFQELRRVVKTGGTYTIATWCINDDIDGTEPLADAVDKHYASKVHSRSEYLFGLESSGFKVTKIVDKTSEAIPYWELRSIWEHASGIEKTFLDGHKSRKILYLFIQAEAV